MSVKYKKQKLSSDVLAEILRSDDEDELVEFINNSFSKTTPNNNKKRHRPSNKPREEEGMHEIDLSANGLAPKGGISKYDLSSNGESIIVGDKPTNRSRFWLTVVLFVSFVALGVAVAILGPSLLDLKDQVKSSLRTISMVFTARSVGYLLGSIIAGWLFDKWNGYLVLAISCIVAALGLIITPLTRSFVMLVIAIVVQGLALGSLDTGGNVMIVNLYGKNSDAQMQGLHAMFSLGAFVSPLLVGPFLTSHDAGNQTHNSTNVTRNHSNINFTTSNPLIQPTTQLSLKWPFWISVLFFIAPVVVFIPAGFKNTTSNQPGLKTWDPKPKDERKAFRGFTLVLLFIFLLLYVGMEIAIGGLMLTFAYTHNILTSKSASAYLTSTFWGSFCVGRFLGIPLAMRVRAFIILILDMIGCLAGALILVFLSTSAPAWLWVGTSILGFSMASVFPSTMTWAETFMHITGRSASVLVVGAAFGEMTVPLAVGTMMEKTGPSAFLHSILVIVILVMIIFVVIAVLGKRQQKEDIDMFGIHYRKVMEQTGNHGLFSKGDEIVQLLEDSSEIFSVEN